jgi:hypothetical protein
MNGWHMRKRRRFCSMALVTQTRRGLTVARNPAGGEG